VAPPALESPEVDPAADLGSPPSLERAARPLRRAAWRGAAALAILAVLAAVAYRLAGDLGELAPALGESLTLRPGFLALAWPLQTAGWLLLVDTWRRLLGRFGIDLPLRHHLAGCAYSALARALPGSLWAPAGRVAFYHRLGAPALDVGAAVLLEWLLLGLAGLALYAASAPFARAVPPTVALPLAAAAAAAALLLLRPASFGGAARLAARVLRQDPAVADRSAAAVRGGLRGLLAAELVVLAASGAALYLVMRAVAPSASLGDAMSAWALTVALANLLAWLPLTGLIKDGSMVLLLTPLYGSVLVAGAVVVAWRVWMAVCEVSWAVVAWGVGRAVARAN